MKRRVVYVDVMKGLFGNSYGGEEVIPIEAVAYPFDPDDETTEFQQFCIGVGAGGFNARVYLCREDMQAVVNAMREVLDDSD